MTNKELKKGIDVSKWQGDIDWSKVKASGISFAMIRLGYGSSDGTQCGVDSYFHKNVVNAVKAGVNVGCYFYSYAMSVEAARKEAQFVVNTLKNYKGVFTYPISFDLEDPKQQSLGKTVLTNMVIAFGDTIEKAGYWCSLYSNLNWLNNILDDSKLTRFDHWVAQWASACTYSNKSITGMWQYSSKGKVNGINGNVDLDIAYKDYPTVIRSAKLNGFTSVSQAPVVPSTVNSDAAQKPSETVKPSTPVSNTPAYKEGDVVKIVGSKYYSGTSVPSWVKAKQWVVKEDSVGDRVVVDKSVDGKNSICSPFKTSDVALVSSAQSSTLSVGDKVKLRSNATIYGTNRKFSPWVYKSVLYVREIGGNRIVVSILKVGDVTGAVDKKYLIKAYGELL